MLPLKRLPICALLVALVLILQPVGLTLASTYNGTVAFTCVNADASGSGSHVLDRDNTGTGEEQLRVDITDGDGTLIYTLTFTNVLGVFAGGIGDFFYTVAPDYNPITFKLTSLAGNGLPEQVDFTASGSCAGLPTTSFAGPGVPGGFVLAYMKCTVAVFSLPGGSAVPGAVIKEGQTFFVNPKPVLAADGTSWTEVFVSSSPNGYIPTRCVA